LVIESGIFYFPTFIARFVPATYMRATRLTSCKRRSKPIVPVNPRKGATCDILCTNASIMCLTICRNCIGLFSPLRQAFRNPIVLNMGRSNPAGRPTRLWRLRKTSSRGPVVYGPNTLPATALSFFMSF
jgi:hypothetical protein